MDSLFSWLRPTVGPTIGRRKDQAANTPASQPQSVPNQAIIDEFLSLSRSPAATDVHERLRIFQQCDAIISGLEPGSSARREISSASVPLLCGGLLASVPLMELGPQSEGQNPYVRMVDKPNQATPNYDDIFKNLLERKETTQHPKGLSGLTLAFGSLISLCISQVDRTDIRYNKAPGFLDLSVLYGVDEDEIEEIRALDDELGRGLMLPDATSVDEERMVFLPRAAWVILILFNRNHNYIARRLLEENEHGKWLDPAKLDGDQDLREQDDEIFELARRINCGLFRNIVVNDFLKSLMGMGSHHNNPTIELFSDTRPEELRKHRISVEFSMLYNWWGMLSEVDATAITEIMDEDEDFSNTSDDVFEQLDAFLDRKADFAQKDKGQRSCAGLARNDEDDCFDSAELAEILLNATESTASAFRACGTPSSLRAIELAAMKQARDWNVCSFNEFRTLLDLPVYKSFSEWCSTPEVASAAQALYRDINNLELYPGLRGEDTLGGEGFRLGKTMSQGLIADIVRMVRCDPNFSTNWTPASLTTWGHGELVTTPENGAFGACLPKLLLRHLPDEYTYNSVYGLFPFATPAKSKEALSEIPLSGIDYEFERPQPATTLDTVEDVFRVFNDPEAYPTPYGDDLKAITGGYGYLLGFDDKNTHDRDEWMTLTALIPDAGALGRYATFFRETAEKAIRNASKRHDGDIYQVDVIQDVINAVSARWVAERLCGIPLNRWGGLTEKELYQMLLDMNNCFFAKAEPQDRIALRRKAVEAGKTLTKYIERSLEHAHNEFADITSQAKSLYNELFRDEPPEHSRSHDFLARMAASGRDTKEISANALGLAVMSSVSHAETCAAAVRFYLDPAREEERDILHDLSKKGPEVNEKIMGYIRESQRLNPHTPLLHRVVASDHVLSLDGGDSIELNKGDRISIDLRKTLLDEDVIDPERETPLLQGAGFHKCIGVAFSEKTMPEVFKAIFRLEEIRSEVGKGGSQSLTISYKRSKEDQQIKKSRQSELPVPWVKHACDLILVAISIAILYWILLVIGSYVHYIRDYRCNSPKHLRPWEVYTMHPGPDNKTTPFMYTGQYSRRRRISFVDVDERDMRFKVFVDGKLNQVSTDFELDKTLNCGQDALKCVEEGFSEASVVIPSGKHTIKVEWIGKDTLPGTTLIDWGSKRSRRFMWKQESC
ncbi:hypothetical protein BOTBODRAFT_35487 [Botryobasidium botryosum FD-172 SS1]|uniref:Heme peroxidase n=1 Tax=Botryobasidium botryosum (strain FD-172 SS1) TaxID=930990 RepID=A0A067MH04_BOTB1|nr:hypothetical protein BOTBODRAFT_35487 [Botryobasidium botryosum FD-172 SS1]